MSECPRFGKWIGGCKFKPRYSERLPSNVGDLHGHDLVDILEALREKIYVQDVCVRCGKSVARATLSKAGKTE